MMSSMRENAKYILWAILIIFVLTIFALWGAQGSMGQAAAGPDIVAKVNGEEIPYTALGSLWSSRRQELYDDGIKITEELEKEEKKKLLDEIIEHRLKLNYAKKLDIFTTDEEVAEAIASIPAFRDENGRFNADYYMRFLSYQRIRPEAFENEQRERVLLIKLRNLLWTNVKVTGDELRHYFMKRSRKIKTNYVYFNYKNYTDELRIDEERLKDYYAVNKKNYAKPEKVRASHILIRPDASPTSPTGRTEEDAEKFAKELLVKIKQGESFSSLAKKYSQDPGSKDKGGDLGWFSKGMMVPEFENAAYSLKKGEVSKPVKTQFGFHIIRVTDKEKGFEPTFAKVRSKVLSELRKKEGLQLMLKKAKKFRQELESPGDFIKLARKYKLEPEATGYFTENDDLKEIESSSYKDVLFDLNSGDVSPVIRGENGCYLFRITGEKKTVFSENEFEDKKSSLKENLKSIKFEQLFNELMANLRAEAEVEIYEENLL